MWLNMRGWSLIELLLALLLASLMSLALGSCALALLHHHQQQQRLNQLTDDLLLVAGFISRELRRSGYWGEGAALWQQPQHNPFLAFFVSADGHCLLYRYDLNGDGLLQGGAGPSPWHALASEANPSERFGIRLRDGALQLRKDDAACDSATGWETLTSTNSQISPQVNEPPFALTWPQPVHGGWQLRPVMVRVKLQLSHSQQPELLRPLQLAVVPRNGGAWHYAP